MAVRSVPYTSIAIWVIPRIARAMIVALVGAGASISIAQSSWPPRSPNPAPDADLRKLDDMAAFFRTRNADRYGIKSPDGIDEGRYIKVGGIDQWITLRGRKRSNPVILLLHGGPGDVTNPYSYPLFGEWEKSFTLVQWDQRGGGRTLHNTDPASITIDRLVQDGLELTQQLLKDLRQDKLILVGHSWGSTLGALMAKARPDLFHAFVGTGQVANSPKGSLVGYNAMVARARAIHDEDAIRELTAVGPPPYPDFKGWPVLHKWRNRLEGSDRFIGGTLGFALAAPGYTPADVTDWVIGQDVSGRALFNATNDLPVASFSGEFKVPVFVIQGDLDYTTPSDLAREYVAGLKAPKKAFVTIPDSGHFAMFMKPEAFLVELKKRVMPLLPK
jgi:pimeloyl-ACP methyl ester carboxylesterase